MFSIGIAAGFLLSSHQALRKSSDFRPINIGSGIIIEQIYVNDDHARKSWRIDGTPIKNWIATAEMRSGSSHYMSHRWNLYVKYRHAEFIHSPSIILQPIRGALIAVQGQIEVFDLNQEGEEFASFPIQSIAEGTTEFKIGIEGGKWNDVTVYEKRNKIFELVKGSPFDFVVNDPAGLSWGSNPGDIGVTIPQPFDGELRNYRVAFINGKHTSSPYGGFYGASSQSSYFNYSNWYRGPFLKGDKIALQTRGYKWTTIKGAVLRPDNRKSL